MVLSKRVDWVLAGAVLALAVVSCLLVTSATHDQGGFLKRQVVNVLIGLALLVLVWATDLRWVRIVAPLIYLASIAGLVLVHVIGTTVNGAKSWVHVAGMSLEPSEFAKPAVVIAMALVLAERSEGRWRARTGVADVVAMLAVAAVPAGLIVTQPDLGTTIVLSATVFGVLAASGAPRKWLALLALSGLSVATLVVAGGFLKKYQLDRFMAFTNPSLDPNGAGYNVEQARIAIGNGGLFGQGLFHGTQTSGHFVPEQQTDFVFTVAGEELGLIGAGLLIVLLGIVVWRALRIASRTDDLFGRVAAAGIACWIGFQAFENIGMCLGITPVTGIPLPFVSYGGSSMFAGLMAVGLLLNIDASARERRTSRMAAAPGLALVR